MARNFVPIQFGTMVKAGDIPHIPGDVSEEMVNVFHRPGPRVEKRPPWKSDVLGSNPQTGYGYMKWFDRTNQVDRLLLDNGDLYVKALSPSENWAAAIVGALGGVSDFANFRDAIYWLVEGYANPARYSYNGVSLDLNPFRESFSAKSIVAWKNRLWLFNILDAIDNLYGHTFITQIYGATGGFTNITVKSIVVTGTTLTTWTPTSTTVAVEQDAIPVNVPASSEATFRTFRADFLGLAPLYRMPMTMAIVAIMAAARSTAYAVGSIRVPTVPNGYRYRVVASAGNTGAGEPAWNTVIGSDTVDGGVTWHNDGEDAFEKHEFEVDSATENEGRWQTEGLVVRFPPMPSALGVGVRISFGNSARPTWELQPIGVGFQDGLPDGTPGKRNYGRQVTEGRFFHDFVNTESGYSAVIRYPNRIIACEAGSPKEWRSDVWFEVVDGTGGGTVLRPFDDLMCAHKRDAISVYQIVEGEAAARLPMRFAGVFKGSGAIGTRAIDELDGVQYFIGDKDVYAFTGTSAPVPIVPDELREAIFDRAGGKWVEDVGLQPTLRADVKNKELRIYTQRDKIWVHNLITKKWTSEDVTKDANGGRSDIKDLAYFRDKFYSIAVTNKLVREDTSGTQDDVYGVGSYDVIAEMWLHPFEQIPESDALIEFLEVHHKITGVQGSSKLEVSVSFDRGATFPKEHEITIPITSRRPIQIPLWQSGPDLIVRLRHLGKAGPDYFNAFWVGAMVQSLGTAIDNNTPAEVSATL